MAIATAFWVTFTMTVQGFFAMLGGVLGLAVAVAIIGLILAALISRAFGCTA